MEFVGAWPQLWGPDHTAAMIGLTETSQESRLEFLFTGKHHLIPGKALS